MKMYKWKCPECGKIGLKATDPEGSFTGLAIHYIKMHKRRLPSYYYFQVEQTTVEVVV